MSSIVVEDLQKRYGDLDAVVGVSFRVEPGETFGILGPNGAGKTTTLEIIEGLRQADGGSVAVLGLSPWPRNAALVRRIGVQLQASAFFEHLTAREQLRVFARVYGVPDERADAVLDLVGLTDKAATRAERLSGGQAQRLAIATALVHEPEIVFLDEPTAALDPQARRNLWDVIRAIADEGTTVILTTHYLDEAETLCDRVAIMDHGRILALDTPDRLVAGLDAPTRVRFESAALTLDEVRGLPGVIEAEAGEAGFTVRTVDPSATVAELAARRSLGGLRVEGATLEDVFLQLTGREYRA